MWNVTTNKPIKTIDALGDNMQNVYTFEYTIHLVREMRRTIKPF